MAQIDARDRLIVALDLPDVAAASAMVARLDQRVNFFKVGLSLQLAPGVEGLIQSLLDSGRKLFLDYKYYDIPETLTKAVCQAAQRGVTFLTVHGSSSLIKAAVRGRGESGMKLFTVTVLTSWDKSDLLEMGYSSHTVEQLVLFRAKMALEAGCDGVIASGQEAKAIKTLSNKLLVITPGIRPDGSSEDDQKRRTTPRDAILAGADYLVIGRPITGAPDPASATEKILDEMQKSFDSRPAS
ncbi:MAG TPA: orotidine-5'-phosphate decarboxylase [Bryobacteraceae bacterium]|nr:orotidine-5'-phosphate decarboxylase [Bryobacteraceae bacterium]